MMYNGLAVRKRKGISLVELERRSYISRNTLLALEHGKQTPRLEYIPIIAKALGCTCAELINLDEMEEMASGNLRL